MILRILTFATAMALAVPVHAATFRVNSTADEVDAVRGDGICASASGVCTLRAAIQEANALPGPDAIRVRAGTYKLTLTSGPEEDSGDLDSDGPVRIVGAGAASTIIDGNGIGRVLSIGGKRGRVVIAKLTVRGGDATVAGSDGGGILVGARMLVVLKKVVVEDNTANGGGGIESQGRLKMKSCTVRRNTAEAGGGLLIAARDLSSEIRGSTFNDNLATGEQLPIGGLGGTSFLVFTGHDIAVQGPTTLTIANSTLTGQIQTLGYCVPELQFCVKDAIVILANVTVNEISEKSAFTSPGSFTLRNTILLQCDAVINSQGYNFIAPEGCAINGSLAGVVVGDSPILSSLGDHGGPTDTRVPVAVSAAVDGGSPLPPGSGGTACEATDQRGVVRPDGMACDMGAVEAH